MGADQSKKEHLLPPDPFQRNFVPTYNPYGSNYFAYSPRRHHRRGRSRHLGPVNPFYMNPYSLDVNPYPLEPYRHRLGPYGGYGLYNYGPSFEAPAPLVVNPPCGGQQCTSYLNESGDYQSPIGTECTCCSMGKTCRMNENAPQGVNYNDCCAGLMCNKGVCMKK